jgi:tRNA(Ile2) C34 agmatinyltransferase TiaS
VHFWSIGLGAIAFLLIIMLVSGALLQLEPHCKHCGRRNWSKGVPPWRCRSCGAPLEPRVRPLRVRH